MALPEMIYRLRSSAHLSRENFASILNVSHQAVQKWENGTSTPDIKNIIRVAKYFGVSIDTLLLDGDTQPREGLQANQKIQPKYANMDPGESYSAQLQTEYTQSLEEGRDIQRYADLFSAVEKMPAGAPKEKIADVIFDLVQNAAPQSDYPYTEPSDLDTIRSLRKPHPVSGTLPSRDELQDRIHGAWLGRICGCLLGKPVEGIRTNELHPLLKETGNYPMHRYILSSDITEEMIERYSFGLRERCYADTVTFMPYDDDTNYVVLAQELVEKYGRNFTAYDVSRVWLALQPKNAYFTAERIAFCNFIKGYEPPDSAVYKNPYREWIGAQIRGDYFGYINPGDPETAAEMAFRDASISHVKNGIYGEMWVSAMIACAAMTNNINDIIRGGLAQIPATSRLHQDITTVLDGYEQGISQEVCFQRIHQRYDEHTSHGWCHTISNAMIVAAALLYGGGDFSRSVCMAVETGFDTDCNGATVGSILGMRNGTAGIDAEWTAPLHDTLQTTIFGIDKVSISACAARTMNHLPDMLSR